MLTDFVKAKDFKVEAMSRGLEKDKLHLVTIEYIPTKTITSSENKSQEKAYKQAMKLMEQQLLKDS